MKRLIKVAAAGVAIVAATAFAQTPVPTNRAGLYTQTRSTVTSGQPANITGASLRVLLLNGWASNLTQSDAGQTIVSPILSGLTGPLLGNNMSPVTAGTISGNTKDFITADGVLSSGHCPEVDANGGLVDSGSGCAGAPAAGALTGAVLAAGVTSAPGLVSFGPNPTLTGADTTIAGPSYSATLGVLRSEYGGL